MFTVQDLRKLPPEKVKQVLSELTPQQLEELQYDWKFWGRPEQQEPKGNWKIWLPLAGRGWGKTRCGAEWVRHRIKSGDRRIACVAPTKGDVRRVMVEGESGLLNICWKGDKTYRGAEMGFPVWSPTNNSVTWANGAKAEFFSAEDPERLRGPQFHSAWCFIEGTQVVTDAGEKDVKTLQVGHRVLTSKGFKSILATSQRVMPVGTVVFSNGTILTGTYEHPIWTNDGWVKLGELKEGNIVCAINVSSGTVSGGIATTTDTMSIGEQGLSKEKIETTCTGQNSNTILGKFQKVMMFTTKMVTNLTTKFLTWKSYLSQSTEDYMLNLNQSLKRIMKNSSSRLAVMTVVRNWLEARKLLPIVRSVPTKVQTNEGHMSGLALSVEKPLEQLEVTSVVSVVSTWEEETEQTVYNIEVEGCPEYFANGILTHNCDEICLISSSYINTDSGLKAINTITKKDKVLTRFGYKPVLDAWHTGKRDTWKITTKTGKTLQGTFDHPVMTQDGWKSLGKLQVGESILVLSGMADVGIKPNVITSTEQVSYSTEKSTSLLMGLFQKVSTSITSMKIKGVMTWKILKHFLSQNTLQSIQKEDLCKTLTQGSGQGHSGTIKNLKSSFARSVAHVLNQLAQEQDFAVDHVRTDTITSVEKASREDVYNITVKDCHEYFANGILNHNCAWTRMQETWDMLQFTLRLGKNPRILVTTTPKPVKLLRQIIKPENIASGRVYKTSGSSYENSDNIDLEALSQYEGTRLGRQELYAEILDEAAGALWNRKMIDDAQFDLPEDCIVKGEDGISVDFDASRKEFAKKLVKVVVSVDPAVTANEESDLTGIMVAGIDINGNAYILEDATDRYMPEQWAAKAISLYNDYEADLIVAERNQGGEMVRSTLRTVDDTVPIKMVHASRGKYARAEPVSSLYERGKVKHLKYLEDLEEQMVTWEPLGSIGSPDRLDAMVWAVTNLLLKGYAQAPIKISYGKTINF